MHDAGVDSETAAQRRSRVFWLLIAVAVIVLDQISKYFADSNLDYASPIEILPVLDITLHYNRGAAFSFLSDAGGWQRWFFSVIALAVSAYICIWLMRLQRQQWLLSLALALVLGGAVGNLWDRMYYGHVIDFISVHWGTSYFPTFNIADAGISVGACLLLLDMVLNPEPKKSA
ncbi:signal peptidase II [Zhongshania sp.]|jgi:signal peptidase II|uniref:signal peptidase II n=1 Tax=Zhongshania sp. TaxID=1971902 RepID=UPI001B652A8B|nr:signal peptidase II [Zhongshania sp.]MBQ0796613.1 lipoprotein signal peptidase [Zhongshania sp.]